jgi:hypothetical protein
MLDGLLLKETTPLRISVEGQWHAGRERNWYGRAHAEEPFVAVTFLCTGTACTWSKSTRRTWSKSTDAKERAVRIYLGHYDGIGRDVRVNFCVGEQGGGHVFGRTLVGSAHYQPAVSSKQDFRAGQIHKFAHVEGEPDIDLLILFLARQDVRSARCGLWLLRRHLADAVIDDSIRRMLTYGRTGHLVR